MKHTPRAAIGWACGTILAFVTAAAAALLFQNGCAAHDRNGGADAAPERVSATAPVVSMGNLRTGKLPSRLESDLASFLFGESPAAPLTFLKPMDLAVAERTLLVSEGAFQSVYRWAPESGALTGLDTADFSGAPGALTVAPDGDVLIAGEDGSVRRFGPDGRLLRSYRLPEAGGAAIRVGGIACVGREVWISNVGGHRIEVFDADGATWLRSIGRRGRGSGEFGLPLGLAVHGDEVFVVDMLNARVQVLSSAGKWLRDIGEPGNRLGYLGRPKAVAVGPDGTVFVTDAAWQCVHAFSREGRPLRTFGGSEDGGDAIALPAGITIWEDEIAAARPVPAGFQPDYHVLVSEQIVRPGVRVYAWRHVPEPARADQRGDARSRVVSLVENPHWNADRCVACHSSDGARFAAIEPERVDRLCLSCHDGKHAVAEAHPIGRLAVTSQTRTPEGWPLVDSRIGCLTCHDVRRHCDSPSRPTINAALVRGGYESGSPLQFCTQCHVADSWRVNPHRSELSGMTSSTASCGFCHVTPSGDAAAASRGFDAALRAAPTQTCLNCHTMHADPAPGGHLNAAVTPEIRAAMLAAEGRTGVADATPAASGDPQLLPLDNGRVSCATCHNPHPADRDTAALLQRPFANARSTAASDVHKALRVEHIHLCQQCHPK